VGSRAWIYRQYDHIVRDGTVVRPGAGDAAVVRLFCEDERGRREKLVAMTSDCNGRFCELDPRTGAAMAVAEACRNLACVGAAPIGLTDCLNFGNPQRPEIMAQFRDAIDGIADACKALDVPVVSGNVSLYNETTDAGVPRAVLPTPTIGAVGLFEKVSDVVGAGFRSAGDLVFALGPRGDDRLGGSEWLTRRTGRVCGRPPSIDLAAEAALQRFLVRAAREGLLASAHDCAEGGLLVALAEACILGQSGAALALPADYAVTPGGLFGEDPTRVIVSVTPWVLGLFTRRVGEAGVPFTLLGKVGGDALAVEGVASWSVAELREAHASALDSIVG
jgi:phosphoribosylformylglycinamidine synthase